MILALCLYTTIPTHLLALIYKKTLSLRDEVSKIFRLARIAHSRTALRESESLSVRLHPVTSQSVAEEKGNTLHGIDPDHLAEWDASCIDREITALTVKSLSGTLPYDYLLYSPHLRRRNDGRLVDSLLRQYRHTECGGWWASGVDVLTNQPSLWGCFKPDSPRIDTAKNKPIKYEHPSKIETEIFALQVPPRIWETIAYRYSVPLPENYRMADYGAFWRWVIANPTIPVILCEGAKKSACVLSHGYAALGVPGVNSCYRVQKDDDGVAIGRYLIPQLQVFATPGRRIFFCFDADKKASTVYNVNRAITASAHLFFTYQCEIKIMQWHHVLGKGIDDVVSTHGEDLLHEIYRDAKDFDDWKTQQSRRLTYIPDLVINRRYVFNKENPNDILPPHDAELIAIIAPKNCGKTKFIEHLVKPFVQSGERKVLLLSHLIQLNRQTARRLGIRSVNDNVSLDELRNSMSLCVNSLLEDSQASFDPDEWRGAWLIIDEVEQVIWTLLSAETVAQDRIKIVKNLKKLIENVLNFGGKIVIADADLRDTSIDFLEGLIGRSIKKWILKNEFKFEQPWTIYHFQDKNPTRLLSHLESSLKEGKKVLLLLAAQKKKSRFSTYNIEKYFKDTIPGLRTLRIDSKTIQNPDFEAFNCTENLNEIVPNYDLVLSSPSLQTGVSIEVEHFDAVFGIFQGVQSTDVVRQFLSRYRPTVPRYIWIKPVGFNFQGSGGTTEKALLSAEKAKDTAHIRNLSSIGIDTTCDGKIDSVCLRIWAKMAAVINVGMKNYGKEIIGGLKDEGHIIVPVEASEEFIELGEDEDELVDLPSQCDADALKSELTEIRDVEYKAHREDVSRSNSLTDRQYNELKKRGQKTTKEQLEEEKGKLERLYNIDITPDIVQQHDDGWYSRIKFDYFLSEGEKYLQFHDGDQFTKQLQKGEGAYLTLDANRESWGAKVAIAKALKIPEMKGLEEAHNEHPLLVEVFNTVIKVNESSGRQDNIVAIKTFLGINLSKCKTPMEVAQRLIKLVGCKFPYLRREGSGKDRLRIYGTPAAKFKAQEDGKKLLLDSNGKAIPLSDHREEVFTAWLKRDAEAVRKHEEESRPVIVHPMAEVEVDSLVVETAPQTEEISQQYQELTQDERDQAALLVETLPVAEDGETVTQLVNGFSTRAIVHALRSLSTEVQQRVLAWCQHLRSLVSGVQWAAL